MFGVLKVTDFREITNITLSNTLHEWSVIGPFKSEAEAQHFINAASQDNVAMWRIVPFIKKG